MMARNRRCFAGVPNSGYGFDGITVYVIEGDEWLAATICESG